MSEASTRRKEKEKLTTVLLKTEKIDRHPNTVQPGSYGVQHVNVSGAAFS